MKGCICALVLLGVLATTARAQDAIPDLDRRGIIALPPSAKERILPAACGAFICWPSFFVAW